MTTSTTESIAEGPKSFIRSRLGSLLAVVPLGVWTLSHVWSNLAAFRGGAAWQESVTDHAHPVAHIGTAILVLLPILIHTVWGLARMAQARPNNLRYGYFNNFKFLLQRLSALGVLLFLGAHIWLAYLNPRFVQGHAEVFSDISHEMRHHGPTLAVYILGTLGVAYHLANGLHGFAMGWGMVVSRKSLRRLDVGVIVFFLALLAMSWTAIFALWRAGA